MTRIQTLCTLLILAAHAPLMSQPKIEFESFLYILIAVEVGEKAELEIPFQNTGNQPLVITGARGNGVPVIDFPKDPIAPSGAGILLFKMPTHAAGKSTQLIQVSTNAEDPSTELTVIVDVRAKDNSSQKISGKVLNLQGEPMPFVRVALRGSGQGTETDFEGHYSIVAVHGDTLVFSSVGYVTMNVVVDRNEINMTLYEMESWNGDSGIPDPPAKVRRDDQSMAVVSRADILHAGDPKYTFRKNAERGVYVIFISGSAASLNTEDHLEFQQKFGVTYSEVDEHTREYVEAYNKLTFKYIRRTCRRAWEVGVRRDAIGVERYVK